MSVPQNRPYQDMPVQTVLADISTPGTAYAVAPRKGRLVRAYSVLGGPVSGTDCTWTMTIDGVALSGTATITSSGSAAGDVDSLLFNTDYRVDEGSSIGFVSGGESTDTASALFVAVIRKS